MRFWCRDDSCSAGPVPTFATLFVLSVHTCVVINFFEAVASLLCYLCDVLVVIIGLLGRSCANSRQCVWPPKLLKAYQIFVFDVYTTCLTGRDSEIRIAACYGLGGAGIGSRWARNFALFQTGPGAHPASCTVGAESLFQRQSGRGVALTSHPHVAPKLKKEKSYAIMPSGSSWFDLGWTLP